MPIKNWRAQERTAEDYKKFFSAYPIFEQYFGEELTLRHLMRIPFNELVEVKHSRHLNDWYDKQGEYIGQEMHTFKEYSRHKGHDWEREVREMGFAYLVPGQYQGLRHAKIILPCLRDMYPWMSMFKLAVYEIDKGENRHNEFYVQLQDAEFGGGKHSLYVPYEPFLAGDIEAIRERTRKYWGWYQRGDQAPQTIESILCDPVTNWFFRCMQGDSEAVRSEMAALMDEDGGHD